MLYMILVINSLKSNEKISCNTWHDVIVGSQDDRPTTSKKSDVYEESIASRE